MLFHTKDPEKPKKKLSPTEALQKAAHYCAYQERCHDEVKNRLADWGVFGLTADEIMLKLIEQNYLNEERFAKAYAGGKFRIKGWGRLRIIKELKVRHISEYCIKQGLKEINEIEYFNLLKDNCLKKYKTQKDKSIPVKRSKTAAYMIGRGYEPDLVWDVLRSFD